jgi:hypothetical protein
VGRRLGSTFSRNAVLVCVHSHDVRAHGAERPAATPPAFSSPRSKSTNSDPFRNGRISPLPGFSTIPRNGVGAGCGSGPSGGRHRRRMYVSTAAPMLPWPS